MTESTKNVLSVLSDTGLLLLQDKRLPNVVTLVTRETLKTSWWSHAKGRVIFTVLSELSAHPDVLFVKLLQGKVTLVHRQLWPALLTVVSKAEAWQLQGLPVAAKELLASASESNEAIVRSGRVVKEMERRLLAHTQEIHTESGRHEVVIRSWSNWARDAKVRPLRSSAAAKRQIEQAAERIGADRSVLPWLSKRSAAT